MAPNSGSRCFCEECLAKGGVDANGVGIGVLWSTAAKRGHLKRVQMQQDEPAISEARDHLASLKRLNFKSPVPRGDALESIQDRLHNLQLGSKSPASDGVSRTGSSSGNALASKPGEEQEQTPTGRLRRGDKRGNKQERNRLTVKANMILTNVASRIDICSEKLQGNPPPESFQYVENDLPQLRRILSGVTRSVKSVVDRKTHVLRELAILESRFLQLRGSGLYNLHLNDSDHGLSPLRFNTDHHFEQPINDHHPFAQVALFIAVITAVMMGVSKRMGDLLINLLSLLLHHLLSYSPTRPPSNNSSILDQIPKTLETALKKFNLDPEIITYAVCPSCHCTYGPAGDGNLSNGTLYPTECSHRTTPDSGLCRASLLEFDEDGHAKPRKAFHYRSFHDYVASLLSQKDLESFMDESSDELLAEIRKGSPPPSYMTDIFDAEFVRHFKGPTGTQLFLDRPGTEGRYLFAFNLDFFSAEGQTIRGPIASCGLISAVCLNLPLHLRYKAENIYIAGIIPGPAEPHKTEINHYMRIIIDDLQVSWERGVLYSRTASHEKGRLARCAMAFTVNDLPAARMISQWAHFTSHHFCSRCSCFHLSNLGRCDVTSPDWRPKEMSELRAMAEAWRDASTLAEQEALFKKNGIRWSELWRLPYWDQSKMLVVDSMHCLLEGLAQFHFREVLQLKDVMARAREECGVAFELAQSFPDEAYAIEKKLSVNDLKHIPHIYAYLVAPIRDSDDDDPTSAIENGLTASGITTRDSLSKRLFQKNLKALQFVTESLSLTLTAKKLKKNYVEALVEWRMKQPMEPLDTPVRLSTMAIMDHIRSIIHDMDVPSWIPSVPHNFGKAAAGSLKADEWRTMATIYLPVALISAWGEGSAHSSLKTSEKFRQSLDHTMSLVIAISTACRRTMTQARMELYRDNMIYWVKQLAVLYPDTKPRVNGHMALHIYDYMQLFGPVHSWWCFPFERLIGQLQRLPSNHKFGQLEGTMLFSHTRTTQLKRWLSRPDCPPIIRAAKTLFDKAFSPIKMDDESIMQASNHVTAPSVLQPFLRGKQISLLARYRFDNVIFSRASTHVGNSLILYFPSGDPSSEPIPASILYIVSQKNEEVKYFVRQHLPAPQGTDDPFKPYPHFFAKVYSTELSNDLHLVKPAWVFSHFARWKLDNERIVVVTLSRD